MAFFGLIVALPVAVRPVPATGQIAISPAGLPLAVTMALRLAAGISTALVWQSTTAWHAMIRSFRALGLPAGLCVTATLAYRYLFVLTESLGEMVEARRSRQVRAFTKTEAWDYAGAGAGVLFAKSLHLTEEVHQAMEARGAFWERPRTAAENANRRLRAADVLLLAVSVAVLIAALTTKGIHALPA